MRCIARVHLFLIRRLALAGMESFGTFDSDFLFPQAYVEAPPVRYRVGMSGRWMESSYHMQREDFPPRDGRREHSTPR